VLRDPEDVAKRVLQVAATGSVTAIDGTEVKVQAESVCVHGDSPGSVEMTRRVARTLHDKGIRIEAVL